MLQLLKRGRSYSTRILVPLALHAILNRKEIWRTLHTRSYAVAKVRAGIMAGNVSTLFLRLRQEAHTMTSDQIASLVNKYLDATLEAGEDDRAMRDHITESERESQIEGLAFGVDIAQEALVSNNLSKVHDLADDLVTRSGIQLDKSSVAYRRLCRELLRAQIEAYEIEQERWETGRTSREYSSNGAQAVMGMSQNGAHGLPKASPKVVTKMFSEVAVVYCSEHKRALRNESQIKSAFTKFLQIIGGDKPLGDITKADCRLYKETLLRTVGISTTNKKLNSIGHMWQWAQGQGFVPEESRSPINGLAINARLEKKEKKERKPFSDEHLNLILRHPTFMEQKTKRPERYWMILCLLLTGARREEIAQLFLKDIQEENGIHFFNITNEGDAQALKNAASKRRVPLHSDLIALGFMKYVEDMRKRKADRLFPQLKWTANGYGNPVGLWFGTFIGSIGLTDPGLVLHSTRHTVITRLQALGVPQDMREVLVGHASRGVHGQVYAHRENIPLSMLKDHLEKLKYTFPLSL